MLGTVVPYGQRRGWGPRAEGRSWVPSTRQGQAHLLQSLRHVQVVVAVRGVVRLGGRAVKGPFQSWREKTD